jgi:Homing endonuclease associated repeat
MQGKKNAISKEQVLNIIRSLALELGRAPTKEELARLGGVSEAVVRRIFLKHKAAVREAGLEPGRAGPRERVSTQQLLEDWGGLARALGKVPTQREYRGAGRYSHKLLEHRFQRWSEAPRKFLEAEEKGELKGEWKDVAEIIRRTPERGRLKERMWTRKFLAAVRRGTPASGCVEPLPANMPPELAGRKCVTATMLATVVASIVLGGGFLRRVLPERPLLGPPLHTETLAHEPVNEMGVSMLFAMVARDLGFIIESVQAPFPDCRAKMEVLPGRWQDVRIEFEKDSRSFAEHGHDPNGCDMIVCWRHNWKGCPPGMMVLELRRIFRNRVIS